MGADSRQPVRCSTCIYFDKNSGDCRRLPPTMTRFGSGWPSTPSDGWCGAWRSTTGDLFGDGPER